MFLINKALIKRRRPMDKFKVLLGAVALLFFSISQAAIIQVDFEGSITDLGGHLQGDVVDLGELVSGSFSYDTAGIGISSFSIAIDSFSANVTDSGFFTVQNDQQNGSATLPADGFVLGAYGSSVTSTELNGYTAGGPGGRLQFGIRRENVDGQLWDDLLLPDMTDWANITLADINAPDWHILDFGLSTNNFWDDQIRWDVSSFTVSDTSSVPEPSTIILLGAGLVGLRLCRRRVK